MNTSPEIIIVFAVVMVGVWLLWRRDRDAGSVKAEHTPWGTAYTVTLDGIEYQSSADGTLWTRGYKSVSFLVSERCRRAVRRARRAVKIETTEGNWPELLAGMSPDFRAKIVAGGLEGQRNAKNSRLLP